MMSFSKRFATVAIAVLLVAVTSAQRAAPASVLLEAGRQKETLEGDLRGAIAIYKDVVSRYSKTDRPASATALLRMAECYEKLADPQASGIYEQILANYSDQAAAASAARSRLSSGMPRLICEQCGDLYGSVSPDGRFMATVSPFFGGDNTGDIGVLELATNKLTPLHIEGAGKTPSGIALAPRFSPDMRHIAYLWAIEKEKAIQLRVVARDGSGKPRVLVHNPEITYIEPHAWSTNGSILAILQRPDRTWEIALVAAGAGTITKVKSLDWRIAGPQHESSLSTDGRFIAYAALTTNPDAPIPAQRGAGLERQIYVVAADGSSEVALTSGAGVKRHPVWTPDASHVMYMSNVGGSWALWAVPMRAGKPAGRPVLVKNDVGVVSPVGMTRAGGLHLYEGRPGVVRTVVAALGSTNAPKANVEDAFIGARPSWSPDGKLIAFSRPGAAGIDIVVRDLVTGEERVFKKPAINTFPFDWFPDSRGLLVLATEDNRQFWFRLDLSSGTFQRLATFRANGVNTHGNVRVLSPDGRMLYMGTYLNDKDPELDRIVALDLTTGVHRDIFRLPVDRESLPRAAQDFALAISPDGRTLALMFSDRKLKRTRIATVRVDGQGYREVIDPVQSHNLRTKLAWSRDGRWIFFPETFGAEGVTSADTDRHRIMRLPLAGGSAQFTGVEVDGLERFDINGDGSRLAYSSLRTEGSGQLLYALDVSWLMKSAR